MIRGAHRMLTSDGVDAATRLRRELDIPAIFVSANLDDATRARAAGARPVAWISKPFQRKEIARAVCAFFKRDGEDQLS